MNTDISSHPSGAADAESIIEALVHLSKTDIFIISYKKIFINAAVLDTLQPPYSCELELQTKKIQEKLEL